MFVFCIESSHERGLGHLYRTLTLASALRAQGFPAHFLINDHATSVALIQAQGHPVEVVDLGSDGGWEGLWLRAHPAVRLWINDRLDTTAAHAAQVKAHGVKLATFDDRGGGAALSDLHIAALAFEDTGTLQGRRVLHGADYMLLDPDLARHRRLRTAGEPVLLTMGGSDTWGVTPRVMQALRDRGRGATVVLGPAFGHGAEVDAVLAGAPAGLFTVHRGGVPSLAAEMARHGLAITGGGMTPFQANAMGLPCIVIANEIFEIPVGRALARMGGSVFAGFHADMDLSVLDRPLPVASMSQAGMQAIDLHGCDRVTAALAALAEERP